MDSASSYSPTHWPRQKIILTSIEFVLTLMVCASIAWLAQPLAVSGLDIGLGERYASGPAPETWNEVLFTTPNIFSVLIDDARAVLLLRTASFWLPAFALIGLGLLHIARTKLRWSSGLIVTLWSALAVAWRPFGWPMAAGLFGILLGLCLMWMKAFTTSAPDRADSTPLHEAACFWSSLVWPGWVLLTALGWLWIADFAARGPVATVRPGAKYFGLHQADALFLANAIVLLTAARSESIVRIFVRSVGALSCVWQRSWGPWLLLALGVVVALALGWLGHRVNPPLPVLLLPGGGMPHISGEVLRLFAGLAISWAAYRFGEWHSSVTGLWHGLAQTAIIGALCLSGMILSGDMGPAVIMSLAFVIFIAVPSVKFAMHRQAAHSPKHLRLRSLAVATLLLVALTSSGVWLWRTALTDWAPQLSHTAALRETARQNPFSANSPNLAQAHWLMDAASDIGGFGLGRVPYCGARAHTKAAVCTLGSGAPIQLPSDLAFAGLAATWGKAGASACIALLFAWLRVLVLAALPTRLSAVRPVGDPRQADTPLIWLCAWLVAIPCLIAQAQVLISVGGTLAWTPLSGITLPILGYGTASLCVIALWVGLAVRPFSGRIAV